MYLRQLLSSYNLYWLLWRQPNGNGMLNSALLPKAFSQQQRKCPCETLWTGVSRSSLPRPCLYRLWRRSYVAGWPLCTFCRWLRCCCCFNHFHDSEHYLRFDPAACEPLVRLFDTDIYWYLAAVHLWALLWFLSCFFSPWRLCSRCFRTSRRSWNLRSELQLSLALLFFLTNKSCSSLFAQILKTALSFTREILVFSRSFHS